MNKTDKKSFVEDFKAEVEQSDVFYLTDFSGLDVQSITTLRRRIKETGARYLVVKNRLAKRALKDLDIPNLDEHLVGPTGVVVGDSEPVAAAKALSDFAKDHDDRPAFKIGVVESQLLEPEQFQKFASLPPREVLLAQLAGSLQAPLAAMLGALEGKMQEFVGVLEALKEQKDG